MAVGDRLNSAEQGGAGRHSDMVVTDEALENGVKGMARQVVPVDAAGATIDAGPASSVFAVAPHDVNNFGTNARALYVGGAGDVVVVAPDDTSATFVAVPAGTLLPVKAKRVNLTGTTATDIVGLA